MVDEEQTEELQPDGVDDIDTVELRVAEANQRDIGRAIAAVRPGEIVEVPIRVD